MDTEIKVPSVGESIKTGILAAWLKKDGERVKEGEDLFELETEKATIAFPAPVAGTLEILVREGTDVDIGQQVATLHAEEEAPSGAHPPEPQKPAPAAPPLSPAVRRIVAEAELDPEQIAGTGPHGRITPEDAGRAAKAKSHVEEEPPPAPHERTPPSERAPDGRPRRRVAMTALRKKTAERLVRAQQNAAYLTTFNEIDMQNVMGIRAHYKAQFEKQHGIKIGFMSFFVKAACQALRQYPDVNSMIDGDDLLYADFHDIGIAISMDSGLIVPVIRDADRKSFAELETAIASLAERARNKKLLPEELSGGTFTITNGGVFGSMLSTPIPAYPQTAILGMHAIRKRPVVVDDQIVIRPMMYVALTYDHRVIDGREAIGFLMRVKEFIEEPDTLLLEM